MTRRNACAARTEAITQAWVPRRGAPANGRPPRVAFGAGRHGPSRRAPGRAAQRLLPAGAVLGHAAGLDQGWGMAEDADRRPIAARNLGITQRIAAALVARGASPNGISLAGMAAGLLAGLCFALAAWLPGAAWMVWLLGAVMVQARLAANLLDGMVAVGRGIASPVGELYNEVPDRVSDTAVLAGLGVAAGSVALGLAAALAAMLTAYVRTAARAGGAPSDFSGPMAKQHRMALVMAAALWCALVPAAWAGGGWVPWGVLVVIALGSLLTAWRRLVRAAAALADGR